LATSVSDERKISLLDETEVTLRPASINVLKKFMKTFGKMSELEEPDQEKIMDILVECSAVALQKQLPDVAGFVDLNPDSKNKEEKENYVKMRTEYQDMVDMDIVSLVNEVCGGIKFDDPNLNLAATEAAGTN
jgi:hypothetical protein